MPRLYIIADSTLFFAYDQEFTHSGLSEVPLNGTFARAGELSGLFEEEVRRSRDEGLDYVVVSRHMTVKKHGKLGRYFTPGMWAAVEKYFSLPHRPAAMPLQEEARAREALREAFAVVAIRRLGFAPVQLVLAFAGF